MMERLRRLLDRIKASRKSEEREQDIDRVRSDLEVMKRESEFFRRYARRESPQ